MAILSAHRLRAGRRIVSSTSECARFDDRLYRNEGKYDASNVVFRDGEIVVYDKKAGKLPEMRHIDYGLSLFKASVFDAYAADQVFDLAEVMGKLVREKQLAGYEVPERFYEMGSPAGLTELENLLAPKKMTNDE